MVSQKNAMKVLAARERKYRRRDAAIQQACERNAFESPGHDVLTGRGNGVHHSSGNVLFRRLLEQQYEAYSSTAAKKSKLEIRLSIYNDITVTRGMRFLLHVELNNGELQWIRQPKEDAMEKIRQGLCDINSRRKKKSSANSSPGDLVESVHKADVEDATSRTLAPRPTLVSLLTPSSGAQTLPIGQDSVPSTQTAQSRKKVSPCLERQSGEANTRQAVELSSLISSLSDNAAAPSDNRLLNNFTSTVLNHILEGFGQQ